MQEAIVEKDEATELAHAKVAVERLIGSSLLPGPGQEAVRAFANLLALHAPERALTAVSSAEPPRPSPSRPVESQGRRPLLRLHLNDR